MIEIITKLTYRDTKENKKKSHFEVSFATVIKLIYENIDKIELEKILLCDVRKSRDRKILINLINDSGFQN